MSQLKITERYRILQVLVSKEVYSEPPLLAEDRLSPGKTVVLKPFRISEQLRSDRSNLFKSIDAYLSLAHPGLASHLDLFFDHAVPNKAYSVVEYVPGKPFLPTIKSLTHSSFFDVLGQFCAVLSFLHLRNYVHLDLHPNNALLVPPNDVDNYWRLKLIDLPLLDASQLLRYRDSISFSRVFSAPELQAGNSFDGRADLFSLGALLYNALVGEAPSMNLGNGDLIPSLLSTDGIPIPEITPEFLSPIIRKLLQKNPDRRYSSSYFLMEDLSLNLRDHRLALDTANSIHMMVQSIPFIPTPALEAGTRAIDQWWKGELSGSPQIRIIGPPGAGKGRLSKSLKLYAKIIGAVAGEVEFKNDDVNLVLDAVGGQNPDPESQSCEVAGHIIISDQLQPKSLALAASEKSLPLLVVKVVREEPGVSVVQHDASQSNLSLNPGSLDAQQSQTFLDNTLLPNALTTSLKESISATALSMPGLMADQVLALIHSGAIYRSGPIWNFNKTIETVPFEPAPSVLSRLQPTVRALGPSQFKVLLLLSLAPFPLSAKTISAVLSFDLQHLLEILIPLQGGIHIRSHDDTFLLSGKTISVLTRAIGGTSERVELAKIAYHALSSSDMLGQDHVDALLAHYAAEAGLNLEAVDYCIRGAEKLESAIRLNEALSLYRLALTLVEDNSQRSTLLLSRILHLLDRLGDRGSFLEYSRLLESSIKEKGQGQNATLLLQLAHHYSSFDEFERSLELTTQVLNLPSSQLSVEERAMAFQSLSFIYMRTGRATDAIEAAKNSLRAWTVTKRKDKMREALLSIAGAYYLEGDYSSALRFMGHSSKCDRSSIAKPRNSKFSMNLGILHMESGDLRAAGRALYRGLQQAQQSKRLLSILEAKVNLCMFHQYCGNLRTSANYYFEILGPATSNGYRHVLHAAELSHAENLARCGQLESALQLLESAKADLHSLNNEASLYWAELQTGLVLLYTGDYKQSLEHLIRLSSSLANRCYRFQESLCLLGIVSNLMHLGELADCAERLDAASSRISVQNVISNLAQRLVRARHDALRGHVQAAKRQFLRTAELARRLGYRIYYFEALLGAASLFQASGEHEDVGRILPRLAGLHCAIKDRLLEPWLFQAMADHAAAVGEERESKKHLLNARTSLLEMAYNIGDLEMRKHFLNRQDSKALLARSEDLEDLAYEGFPEPQGSPRATRALESIARINEQLHRRDSLKSTLGLILDEAIHLSEAERGIVFLFDPSGREELKVSRNVGRRSLADARRYTRTALQRIRHGEIVFAADTFTDPQLSASESITQLRIRSVTCVPLRSRNSVIGALYLDSRRPRLAASPELLKSLEIFAQQAAAALERAIRYFHLAEENRKLRETALVGVPNLIGQGTYFTGLKKLIAAASNSDLPVLILGESGTGKELVARAIHYSGKRSMEPFLSVDCGALPENLVESELFGYRRGAFTSADQDKDGLFVAARGGSLFLDEIGNTTPTLQAKLLRSIQEREIRPLGGTQAVAFSARLIAATNRDLKRDARDGRFRQDLLFRLNGITIEIPSLRDRKAEVPLLVNHFLQKTHSRYNHRVTRISDEALQALSRYDWPGNIRELENCIERAVALAQEETIHLKDLPDSVRAACVVGWSEKKGEHRLIEEALARFAGDKSRAAEYIGWNRQKLYRKMEQYNIPIDFGRRNTA